ncbi:MAG: protein TolR, partial [Zetaproteobacteria bacterium CG_4_8_14_3_um_filter_59_5]
MWTGSSKWDKDNEPMGEINVTPLVDVMLVLLIIFMVTAPLLTQGVDVDLPDAVSPPMQQNVEPLVVSIGKKGDIHLQKSPITLEQLA